jgi:hypothetical protein
MRHPNEMHVDNDSGETRCPTMGAMLERMPQPELQIVPVPDTEPPTKPVHIEIINAILDNFPDDGVADEGGDAVHSMPLRLN